MRTAALYDIHGNLPALEAVLQEIASLAVEQIIIGGDVVPGPMSRECLDRLLEIRLPIHFILGNCEVAALAEMDNKPIGNFPEAVRNDFRWTAKQLLPRHKKWIMDWPKTVRLTIDGVGKALFCHATPRDENEIFTRLTPEEKLAPIFEMLDVDLVVCGHTHMQFDRRIGGTRVVNAGSLGMPFGKPGAHWLLLGPDIELRRTDYDLTAAADRVLKTTYPRARHFAENHVLQPPTEAAMLKILSRAG